jgi:peptidoglycan/xylan/chitin deacetylase (PgdA/CDA1 family)
MTISSRTVPILLYHRISNWPAKQMRRLTLRPDVLEAQLKELKSRGFIGLTVTSYVKCLRTSQRLPEKPIVLTFDDGFKDFITDALPLLEKYGFPCTLYIVAGLVGNNAKWLRMPDRELPLLNWSDLRKLASAGVEIGSHTVTHPALDLMKESDVCDELLNSKRIIERELSSPVESIAYPFGFRNQLVRRIAESSGYSSACAVRYRASYTDDDQFDLPRHLIADRMNIRGFTCTVEAGTADIATVGRRLVSEVGSFVRSTVQGYI